MTSRILTARREATDARWDASGGTEPTRVLDWRSDPVQGLATAIGEPETSDAAALWSWLGRAHERVAAAIRPVYAMNERQPASRTITRGRGSCSQRFAVLEALARSRGIATRTHAVVLPGEFWAGRFRGLTWLIPDEVVVALPEFRLDGWRTSRGCLAGGCDTGEPRGAFTNDSAETLFEAVARGAMPTHLVIHDLGYFDVRDDFVDRCATLAPWAAFLLDPLLSRVAPRR